MTSELRVSVIIPTYNAERFISEAIGSIRAQARPPDEIIVVDDGSTDQTVAAAANLGPDIRILRQPSNLGVAAARNRGIEAATGTVVAWLDADDLWPPDAMSLLLSRLQSPPFPGIVAGRLKVIGDNLPTRPPAEARDSLDGFAMNFGCSVIRREVFRDVGLLNPELLVGSDADWFLRAREKGVRIAVVDDTTLIYRRHGANLTKDIDGTMYIGLKMLKQSLDRRRADGKIAESLPPWPVIAPRKDEP